MAALINQHKGNQVIILLTVGDKKTQESDIKIARTRLSKNKKENG